MAKKPRTAKQLANDERLRNARKKVVEEEEFEPSEVRQKNEEVIAPPVTDEVVDLEVPAPPSTPLPTVPTIDPNLIATIVATVQALQSQNPQLATATAEQKIEAVSTTLTQSQANEARIGAQGVQGIVFKYPVEASYYPDPTDRLFDEAKLRRFAMRENYIFRWAVEGETFQKNGVTFAEPRFIIELFRRLYDDNGEPMLNPKTGRPTMALVARQFQHEDEVTTRVAAQRMGILEKYANDEKGFRELMDEVRYWRIQQWLFSIFTPPKVQTFANQSRTMVINGKVVEVYDTEKLTDHDTAVSQVSSLQTESGVGTVRVPE